MATAQASKNIITLKGSTDIITEFFGARPHFAHALRWQRRRVLVQQALRLADLSVGQLHQRAGSVRIGDPAHGASQPARPTYTPHAAFRAVDG